MKRLSLNITATASAIVVACAISSGAFADPTLTFSLLQTGLPAAVTLGNTVPAESGLTETANTFYSSACNCDLTVTPTSSIASPLIIVSPYSSTNFLLSVLPGSYTASEPPEQFFVESDTKILSLNETVNNTSSVKLIDPFEFEVDTIPVSGPAHSGLVLLGFAAAASPTPSASTLNLEGGSKADPVVITTPIVITTGGGTGSGGSGILRGGSNDVPIFSQIEANIGAGLTENFYKYDFFGGGFSATADVQFVGETVNPDDTFLFELLSPSGLLLSSVVLDQGNNFGSNLPFDGGISTSLPPGIYEIGIVGNVPSDPMATITFNSPVGAIQSAVPEPDSWVLMLLGIGLAGGLLRLRKGGRGDFATLVVAARA